MARTTEKVPALPWYPKDFIADEHVIAMSLEAEGAYRRLLDHQWLHGSVPADMRLLAGICKGVSVAKMRRLWQQVGTLFLPMEHDVTRLQNAKLERVRQEREQFIEGKKVAGSLGGIARSKRLAQGKQNGSSATKVLVAKGKPSSASASASAGVGRSPTDLPTRAVADLARECTIACNRGLRDNPLIGTRFNELTTSNQHGIVAGWLQDGVLPEGVPEVIYERAKRYTPKPDDPQPNSLAYFTRAVRRAQRLAADLAPQGEAAPPARIRDALDPERFVTT